VLPGVLSELRFVVTVSFSHPDESNIVDKIIATNVERNLMLIRLTRIEQNGICGMDGTARESNEHELPLAAARFTVTFILHKSSFSFSVHRLAIGFGINSFRRAASLPCAAHEPERAECASKEEKKSSTPDDE
jgi:hypothetical protein